MTAHPRIIGFVLCLLLASATNGWAAGKRKHGRSKTPVHTRATPTERVVEPSPGQSTLSAAEARSSDPRTTVRESVRQESRIEFDERMLRGQSAAGVIYLFQRTPSDWKSTVEVPDSFRQRTVEVVTPAEEKK